MAEGTSNSGGNSGLAFIVGLGAEAPGCVQAAG